MLSIDRNRFKADSEIVKKFIFNGDNVAHNLRSTVGRSAAVERSCSCAV